MTGNRSEEVASTYLDIPNDRLAMFRFLRHGLEVHSEWREVRKTYQLLQLLLLRWDDLLEGLAQRLLGTLRNNQER